MSTWYVRHTKRNPPIGLLQQEHLEETTGSFHSWTKSNHHDSIKLLIANKLLHNLLDSSLQCLFHEKASKHVCVITGHSLPVPSEITQTFIHLHHEQKVG